MTDTADHLYHGTDFSLEASVARLVNTSLTRELPIHVRAIAIGSLIGLEQGLAESIIYASEDRWRELDALRAKVGRINDAILKAAYHVQSSTAPG